MSLTSKIYQYSPTSVQNVGVSAYGYYWRQRRYGGIFKSQKEEFLRRENYSETQWNEYQTIELRKLLLHAFETVPFYNNSFSHHGITRSFINKFELDQLNKLPFLEKNDLRKFGTTTLVSKKRQKGGEFYSSSGSTGTPTKILFSHEFHQKWSAAFETRIRYWAGINYKTPRGMIGGRRVVPDGHAKRPFYRTNRAEKQTYFSAYHISENNIDDYLEGMVKNKVEYMNGYAVSNFLLAKLFDQNGIDAPKLKAVITSSEKLHPEMRNLLSRVYKCPVYDSYSGVEACGLISENKHAELLSSPDVGIIEVLDNNLEEVSLGTEGELVSTGLLNYDQPLIRYRIGDNVTMAKSNRSVSGLSMPIVQEIGGRVEDTVTGPDGRVMVRFHGIFIDIPGLVQSQLIQSTLNEFTLRLVVDNQEYSRKQNEEIMTARMTSQLGPVNTNFEYVETIPREASGKYKAVVSKIK